MTQRTAPTSTLVFLVRHGRTPTTGKILPGRTPGLHLGDEGTSQAVNVAESFKGWQQKREQNSDDQRITAVYSSPMERTYETATPIAKSLGLRVRKNKGLIEADFGDWTGKKLSDLRKKPEWLSVQNNPSGFRFPGGESFSEMQLRMVSTLEKLVTQHQGEAIIAVSHADTIKATAAHALGIHLDLFQRIVVDACSITAIQYSKQGPYVLGLNTMSAPTSNVTL